MIKGEGSLDGIFNGLCAEIDKRLREKQETAPLSGE
jgi:hypothetical protein